MIKQYSVYKHNIDYQLMNVRKMNSKLRKFKFDMVADLLGWQHCQQSTQQLSSDLITTLTKIHHNFQLN